MRYANYPFGSWTGTAFSKLSKTIFVVDLSEPAAALTGLTIRVKLLTIYGFVYNSAGT